MAKKIVGFIKLQVPAGKANPSPPIGPALGQRGLNIMEFCKAFNAQTQGVEPGLPLPVVITAFADKILHLHHQDATCSDFDQEGHQDRQRFYHTSVWTRWARSPALSSRKLPTPR